MSVVVVVSEGCVLCVKVGQKIDRHVGVVEEGVEACEGEPSVRSAVCRGNKKGSMLSVNLCCEKVG